MAIVIRTAYNNKEWKGPCDTPGKDPLCFYCFKGLLGIHEPKKNDVICSGECWEQHICVDYKWGCPPKGRYFGSDAYPGASVFLVFKQPNGRYTIWGRTVINSVDKQIDPSTGFSFIHLDPFNPLPKNKWVEEITDEQLVGARWLMGRHRYIDMGQEKYLDRLLAGDIIEISSPDDVKSIAKSYNSDEAVLGTTISPRILKKLEEIAAEEGRITDELVREAIATWIRTR